MLGNYLQQTTSADVIFQMHFFLALSGLNDLLFASILKVISNVRQLFAADDFSRRHFSDAFFLGTFRVKLFACQQCFY